MIVFPQHLVQSLAFRHSTNAILWFSSSSLLPLPPSKSWVLQDSVFSPLLILGILPLILTPRTSLLAQWLRLCVPNAGHHGSIPDQGTKISHGKYKTRNHSLAGLSYQPRTP